MTEQQLNVPFLLGPQDAETACLLIHGFSGNPAEMRELGEALAAHGLRVYGMLVAGHSGDPEALIRSGRRQWLASATEGLAQLSQYQRVFIAGLSMGGVLALRLAMRYPARIAGVIALSTPTRFTGGWQVKVVPLARYFVRWFYPLANLNFNNPKVQAEVLKQARLRNPDATIDFSDAQAVAYIKHLVRLPIPALAELFALTNQARRRLGRVRSPLLIIHSKRDQTVNPACASELERLAVAAFPKSLHWLERSGHAITTDVEHETVYQLVRAFIEATENAVKPSRSVDVQQGAASETFPDR